MAIVSVENIFGYHCIFWKKEHAEILICIMLVLVKCIKVEKQCTKLKNIVFFFKFKSKQLLSTQLLSTSLTSSVECSFKMIASNHVSIQSSNCL